LIKQDESSHKEKTSTGNISNERTQSTVQNRIREDLKISTIISSKIELPLTGELNENNKLEETNDSKFKQNIIDSKNPETNKNEDVFDKEIILNKKNKSSNTQIKISQKKESYSNMDIFKQILESEKGKRKDSQMKFPFFANESYINHSIMKVNNQAGVNNSTFLFDEKKENDIVLCISNLNNNNDFLENSIDSNFKKEILSTNSKLVGGETNTESKTDLEISQHTNRLNNSINNENLNLLTARQESFFRGKKCRFIVLMLLILVIILLSIFLVHKFIY